MIADLHNVTRVQKIVNIKENVVYYGRVGKKVELKLIGVGDFVVSKQGFD